MFIKSIIFYFFDLKCYFWIETNAFDFVIGEILNKLLVKNNYVTSNYNHNHNDTYSNLCSENDQLYMAAFISQIMISANTY